MLTIYILIKLLFQWKNQLFNIPHYLEVIQLIDAGRQNPERTIHCPDVQRPLHFTRSPLFQDTVPALEVQSTLVPLKCKIGNCLLVSNKCNSVFISQGVFFREHTSAGVKYLLFGFLVNQILYQLFCFSIPYDVRPFYIQAILRALSECWNNIGTTAIFQNFTQR